MIAKTQELFLRYDKTDCLTLKASMAHQQIENNESIEEK
jgi:hypothetical protein